MMPLGGIDYYGLLDRRTARMAGDKLASAELSTGLSYERGDRRCAKAEIGDSVVFGFRAQAFVTRAHIAVMRGISKQRPEVAGVYDTSGKRVPRWVIWQAA